MGNKNAVGNRGGGRKSAYQELADAALLREMFFGEFSRDELQAKIRSGEYSLKDRFVSEAFTGNERMLLALFNKAFPEGAAPPKGDVAPTSPVEPSSSQ